MFESRRGYSSLIKLGQRRYVVNALVPRFAEAVRPAGELDVPRCPALITDGGKKHHVLWLRIGAVVDAVHEHGDVGHVGQRHYSRPCR